jgi:SHS2 domain-containing protein
LLKKRISSHPRAGIRQFSHTADLGFRLYGPTLAAVFCQAAHALYGVMTDRRKLRPRSYQEVVVEAADPESLLVEWLNHLLYLYDTTGFLGKKVEVLELTPCRLQALVWGEPLDPDRHELKSGIKAATYHNLAIKEVVDGWEATLVLDL